LILSGLKGALGARIGAAAAALAMLALAGCQTDGPYSAKHLRPLSAKMISLMESKGMDKTSPLLVRVFKEEAELEVWKKDNTGKFALLKTYPICRWSGQLGPKVREGDRQAPEGFYAITPSAMNPNSSFYLSFNLGYPNAFDRAHGRTGAHLMVHGDCSSRGCYSMTDEQIAEIFALGREAFFAGQRSFQVQAYPFRMTALNMARHRNNPHMAFWRNLKEGYDHFEVTRQEPKVSVCEKRYVFNAEAPGGATFQAAGKCPAYTVPQEIASAVAEKAQRDQISFADFVKRGTRPAPINTGRDGGMHPVFQAMYETEEVRNPRGQVTSVVVTRRSTSVGPIDYNPDPTTASSPAISAAPTVTASVGTPTDVPMPRAVPGRVRSGGGSTATAYAPTNGASNGGGQFFSGIYTSSVDSARRLFGFGGASTQTAPPAAKAAPPSRQRAARPNAARTPSPPVRDAQARPAPAQSSSPAASPAPASSRTSAQAPASARPAAAASLVTGAQPVVPSGSFDTRWGGASAGR